MRTFHSVRRQHRRLPRSGLRVAVLALLLLQITAGAGAAPGSSLRLVAGTWAPYVDSSLPEYGVAVDIVRKVLRRAGYETQISMDDLARTYEGARVGIFDAVAATWPTPETQRDFVLSDQYLVNTVVVIKRRGSPYRVEKVSDLEGAIVGVISGHTYGDLFERTDNIIRVPSNHLVQGLQRLVDGYVDVAIGDNWAIRNTLHQFMPSAASKLELLPIPLSTRTLHLAVHNSHPRAAEIIRDFNATLAAMRADGSRQAILNRHVGYLRPIADLPL